MDPQVLNLCDSHDDEIQHFCTSRLRRQLAEGGDHYCFHQFLDDNSAAVVIAQAKSDHLPVGLVIVKVEGFQRQAGELDV